MPPFEFVLLLLAAISLLVTVARRIGVAYPILLVVGGIALGIVPGLPPVELDPDLVLTVFLPPLVFAAAWGTPARDLRQNLRVVLLLSVGLVLFTIAVVAGATTTLAPHLPLASALVLGAIVSPSDALAATTVLQQVEVPRRVRSVLEQESLLNDATALTAYRLALNVALGTVALTVAAALGGFLVASVGGILVGVAAALVMTWLWSRLEDPPVEVSLSLIVPYLAYLPAEAIGASGVIAAVVAGIILGRRSSRILTPETRLVAASAWEILTFVLNGFAFLLVGLELRAIAADPPFGSVPELVAAGIVVSAAVVGARFAWVYASLIAPGMWARVVHHEATEMPTSIALVVSWSGMRGAISLAAALALPGDFPDRPLIVVLTFVVIAVTLLGQGLTLPWVARRAELPRGTIDLEEEALARNRTTEAALQQLDELREQWPGHRPLIENLEGRYRHRLDHLPDEDAEGEDLLDPARKQELAEHHAILSSVIAAERETVIRLRDAGEISDSVLRRLERELDFEEARLEAEL